MNWSQFQVLTFDCYGTLIDWETGIVRAVRQVFPELPQSDAEILVLYSELEPLAQSSGFQSYRKVLRTVLAEMAARFGREVNEPDALSASIAHWVPFSDTVPALKRLQKKFRLGVISNIDNDLFASSAKRLEVSFTDVITAEQVGAYKPSLRNFEIALQRLHVTPGQILHVAESLFHDIAPARQLGIRNVWVNRRTESGGATRQVDVQPDFTVRTLTELADLVGV
jgi:2-haloacid dehalogenase